ncbi:MAG: endopeptidase La, partial [Acidobacteria bacterium]|nr:endopeptidase La [Acidobacteriota bacterium]
MAELENVQVLPALPLKNTVLFPHLLMPLSVGRQASLAAVEAVLATEEKEIILVAQKDSEVESPNAGDLYTIGTKAVIRKMSRPNESVMELLVLGIERVVILKLEENEPFLKARVRPFPLPTDNSPEVEALQRAVLDLAAKAVSLTQPQPPFELSRLLAGAEDPLRLVFLLASMFSLELEKEQKLLAADTRAEALRLLHSYLSHELQVLEIRSKIANEARSEMSKEQREYMLRQQLRAIQAELGEKNSEQADVEILRERLHKTELPEDVRKEAERELGRLERMSTSSPDHNVIRTYLELVIELPWFKATADQLDVARARDILNTDHYGLKEIKQRILEHLAVLKLNPAAKAPILCFVGPPGVGKTSLGQSIARSMDRKFERMSLGGLHDEAELRGHRRTYIGAMPGRLIQAIRRAGANNPVIMLDEVDKLGRDFRGDPAAALLEVLDPEQNKTFRDNYLDLQFDLSKVFFVTTANALDTIPQPLLDRMEIIRLAGYTEEEKAEIARRYLIPRQLLHTGLAAGQFQIPDATLQRVISRYTREAGVRRLEQTLGRLARKIALRFAEGRTEPVVVGPEELDELLGTEIFIPEQMRRNLPAGVACGLAWTEAGGDVLYVEATLLPEGKGLTLTGQLGEVMQESVRAAQSYIWSHAAELGIDRALFKDSGLHVHVPAGAIPKDGPSAGVTMITALTSLYTGLPARGDTAMTGEVTLTGLVLPIGGIKEKVLAAPRAGIHRVLLPKANEKDLRDLPEDARKDMEFHFAQRVEDVLAVTIPQLHH